MAFRRQKQDVTAQRRWNQFMVDNVRLVQAIGLLPLIIAVEELWIDVLVYGWAESAGPSSIHDEVTTAFSVSALNPSERKNLVLLTECYFQEGFTYIEPYVLSHGERLRLRSQFDPEGLYLKAHPETSTHVLTENEWRALMRPKTPEEKE